MLTIPLSFPSQPLFLCSSRPSPGWVSSAGGGGERLPRNLPTPTAGPRRGDRPLPSAEGRARAVRMELHLWVEFEADRPPTLVEAVDAVARGLPVISRAISERLR